MGIIKKLFRFLLLGCVALALLIFVVEMLIAWKTGPYLYDNAETISARKVGVLLGTSKHTVNGRGNLYYKYRLEAAVKLYEKGKIQYVLVSGDNATTSYNEPNTIKKDLIKMGIPEDRVVLDFAGFRTLDSVVRSKEVFDEDDIMIISQPFHNKRALYIAQAKDINAIAFNAQEVGFKYGFKVFLRERLARVKMMIDLIFNVQPKYLGEKITIGE